MGNKGRYHVTYELHRVSRHKSTLLNLAVNFSDRSYGTFSLKLSIATFCNTGTNTSIAYVHPNFLVMLCQIYTCLVYIHKRPLEITYIYLVSTRSILSFFNSDSKSYHFIFFSKEYTILQRQKWRPPFAEINNLLLCHVKDDIVVMLSQECREMRFRYHHTLGKRIAFHSIHILAIQIPILPLFTRWQVDGMRRKFGLRVKLS